MKKDTSYHDYVVYDLMNNLSHITSRAMMGGWCIYSKGIPFSLIIDNQVYFKAKGELADKLASLGWNKFNYKRTDGKVISMCYWKVPDELMDNQEKFEEVAESAILTLCYT